MKKVFIIITCFLTLTSLSQSGLEVKENNNLSEKVKEKLVLDTVAFDQFVLLGKCLCMDQIDSTNLYNTVFDELYFLWTPLTRLLGNQAGKKELESYLLIYINRMYPIVAEKLRGNDEIVRSHSHSIIISDRLFNPRYEIRNLFQNYIRTQIVFYGLPHHLEEYLKDSSEVLNNEGRN